MIITLICVAIFIISFAICYIIKERQHPEIHFIASCLWISSAIMIFVFGIYIVSAHTGVKCTISQNQIEYEGLCNRIEVAQSEYEDVSKSDVIKDVYEWNKDVCHEKYWTYNPFTSWFHSKKVTNALQYVEY